MFNQEISGQDRSQDGQPQKEGGETKEGKGPQDSLRGDNLRK
jgi:hypothetical protein